MVKFLIDLYEELVSDETINFTDVILIINETCHLSDAAKRKFKYCSRLDEALETTENCRFFRISSELERGFFIGTVIETFPNIRVFTSRPSKLADCFTGVKISPWPPQKIGNVEEKKASGYYQPRGVQDRSKSPIRYDNQPRFGSEDNAGSLYLQNKERNKSPIRPPVSFDNQHSGSKHISEWDAVDSDEEKKRSLARPPSYYPGTQANQNLPKYTNPSDGMISVAKPQFSSFPGSQPAQEKMQIPKKPYAEHILASNEVAEPPKNPSQGITISKLQHAEHPILGKKLQSNDVESQSPGPKPLSFREPSNSQGPNFSSAMSLSINKPNQVSLPLNPNPQLNLPPPSSLSKVPDSIAKTLPVIPPQGPKNTSLPINTIVYKISDKKPKDNNEVIYYIEKKQKESELLSDKHSHVYGKDSQYHGVLLKLLEKKDFDKVTSFKDLFSLFYKNTFELSYDKTQDKQGGFGTDPENADKKDNFMKKLAEIQRAITRLFEVGYFKPKSQKRGLEDLFKGNCWDLELEKSGNIR